MKYFWYDVVHKYFLHKLWIVLLTCFLLVIWARMRWHWEYWRHIIGHIWRHIYGSCGVSCGYMYYDETDCQHSWKIDSLHSLINCQNIFKNTVLYILWYVFVWFKMKISWLTLMSVALYVVRWVRNVINHGVTSHTTALSDHSLSPGQSLPKIYLHLNYIWILSGWFFDNFCSILLLTVTGSLTC